MKAMGGEEKLAKAAAISWKTAGTMSVMGNASEVTTECVAEGVDKLRRKLEADFNGNAFQAVIVVNGDHAWRKFGDNQMPIEGDALTYEKHMVCVRLVPFSLATLKGKGFKLESAPDEKVGEKMANVVKVTDPPGKSMSLFFDPESGQLIKLRTTTMGFGGDQEFVLETTYGEYKEMGGVKIPTKVNSTRDGESFLEETVKEFAALEKTEPGTFDEP
jgi:hypothetical protein